MDFLQSGKHKFYASLGGIIYVSSLWVYAYILWVFLLAFIISLFIKTSYVSVKKVFTLSFILF